MADITNRADILVEEGLQLYSRGQLDDALEKWKSALRVDNENHRAREYIKYVEDNRTALEDSFRLVGSTSVNTKPKKETSRTMRKVSSSEETEAEGKKTRASKSEHPSLSKSRAESALPNRRRSPSVEFIKAMDEDRLTTRIDGIEETSFRHTARIDLDALGDKIAESREEKLSPSEEQPTGGKNTPSHFSPAVCSSDLPSERTAAGRHRKATPLTLISGGGNKHIDDFDPMGGTPVGQAIPSPSLGLGTEPSKGDKAAAEDPFHAQLRNYLEGTDDRRDETPAGGLEIPSSEKKPTGDRMDIARPSKKTTGDRIAVGRQEKKSSDEKYEIPSSEKKPTGDRINISNREVEFRQSSSASHKLSEIFPTDQSQSGVGRRATLQGVASNEPPPERIDTMLEGARMLQQQGNFEGALWLCERVIAADAQNVEAQKMLEQSCAVLTAEYTKQIGNMRLVPVVQVPQHEIVWHKLDHRAGFLLSRIDGQLSFEDILDVSGMERFEALRILAQLLTQGVIGPRR